MDRSHHSQEEEDTDIRGQSISGVRQGQAWKEATDNLHCSLHHHHLKLGMDPAALTLCDEQAEGEEQVEDKVDRGQSQQQLEGQRQ